jgi:hypothetical protein
VKPARYGTGEARPALTAPYTTTLCRKERERWVESEMERWIASETEKRLGGEEYVGA